MDKVWKLMEWQGKTSAVETQKNLEFRFCEFFCIKKDPFICLPNSTHIIDEASNYSNITHIKEI
jgi:hypothetical protein